MRRLAAALGLTGLLLTGTAAHAAEPLCSLDVDGNGETQALTDGLLVIRHLFGFSGNTPTSEAIDQIGCTRCTSQEIADFLLGTDCAGMLDVDSDGGAGALTDGLLAIRYLFGFRGEVLIDGAIGSGSRTDAGSVETHIAYYTNPRSETLASTLAPGQSATTPSGLAELTNTGTGTVAVEVIEGSDDAGNPVIEVRTNGDGLELVLPDPNQLSATGPSAKARSPEPKPAFGESDPAKPYVLIGLWSQSRAWFANLPWIADGYNRIPDGATTAVPGTEERKLQLATGTYLLTPKPAYQLRSFCRDSATDCYEAKEPVLFIHGYVRGSGLADFCIFR